MNRRKHEYSTEKRCWLKKVTQGLPAKKLSPELYIVSRTFKQSQDWKPWQQHQQIQSYVTSEPKDTMGAIYSTWHLVVLSKLPTVAQVVIKKGAGGTQL